MFDIAAQILIDTRKAVYESVKDLTQDQWFAQPKGFGNNIAWNIGHLIVAQQGLVYRRCGVKGYIGREMVGLYRPGTSPINWQALPDTAELLEQFISMPQKMAEDIAAGKFDNYVKPESHDGPGLAPAESVAHALIGNQYHEGMHRGNIDDLLAFVG